MLILGGVGPIHSTFFTSLHCWYCWWCRNLANQLIKSLSVIPLFTRFYTSQVVVWDVFHQQYYQCHDLLGLSQVVQDFFHQQYDHASFCRSSFLNALFPHVRKSRCMACSFLSEIWGRETLNPRIPTRRGRIPGDDWKKMESKNPTPTNSPKINRFHCFFVHFFLVQFWWDLTYL